MSITEGYKANFDTLCRAAKNNDLAIMECTSAATGEPVMVVCAVGRDTDGSYVFSPVAKMFDGNPYEELIPPKA